MSLYNAIEYPGSPFPQTHPDRLATIAALHGLSAPPVATSRVLEIGCGDGGNLIPMALTLPGATFVGFDLAESGIANGNRTIATLGLTNITLRTADILAVDASWGKFDYIIIHGLYAWVPPMIQGAILRVSSENLAAEGVAYLSYNALPGSRIRQMLREMMLFHAKGSETPQDLVERAQALITFLANSRAAPGAFQNCVDEAAHHMAAKAPWYFFHDELSEVYDPPYFHEFIAAARAHALDFLAEADFHDLSERRFTPDAVAQIDAMAGNDRILREQYADFAIGRAFRQTLLVHAGRKPVLPTMERLGELRSSLYVSTPARELTPGEFGVGGNGQLKTNHPAAIAMMRTLLAAAPQAIPLSELDCDLNILLGATFSGITQLHLASRPLVATPGANPVASALARIQAKQGGVVTTLMHTSISFVVEQDRRLLMLLDGTRSLAELGEVRQTLDRFAALGLLTQ